MLHGWPQHWYMWRHQIPALAERYRLIIPDMRGFGWSDAPPRGYDKETLATDFLNLLDALGLERVRLMGHDWGGWCGFLMCLRAPERFDRFLALNIPPPWNDPNPRNLLGLWRFWYMVAARQPDRRLAGARTRLLHKTFGRVRHATGRLVRRGHRDLRRASSESRRAPRRTIQLYRIFLTREMPSLIRGRYDDDRLTVPTLLQFGVDDFAIANDLWNATSATTRTTCGSSSWSTAVTSSPRTDPKS